MKQHPSSCTRSSNQCHNITNNLQHTKSVWVVHTWTLERKYNRAAVRMYFWLTFHRQSYVLGSFPQPPSRSANQYSCQRKLLNRGMLPTHPREGLLNRGDRPLSETKIITSLNCISGRNVIVTLLLGSSSFPVISKSSLHRRQFSNFQDVLPHLHLFPTNTP